MSKPVLIEYPKTGARYVVTSAAAAAKAHPDARIVSYEDGDPYEEPKVEKPAKAADKDGS